LPSFVENFEWMCVAKMVQALFPQADTQPEERATGGRWAD